MGGPAVHHSRDCHHQIWRRGALAADAAPGPVGGLRTLQRDVGGCRCAVSGANDSSASFCLFVFFFFLAPLRSLAVGLRGSGTGRATGLGMAIPRPQPADGGIPGVPLTCCCTISTGQRERSSGHSPAWGDVGPAVSSLGVGRPPLLGFHHMNLDFVLFGRRREGLLSIPSGFQAVKSQELTPPPSSLRKSFDTPPVLPAVPYLLLTAAGISYSGISPESIATSRKKIK